MMEHHDALAWKNEALSWKERFSEGQAQIAKLRAEQRLLRKQKNRFKQMVKRAYEEAWKQGFVYNDLPDAAHQLEQDWHKSATFLSFKMEN